MQSKRTVRQGPLRPSQKSDDTQCRPESHEGSSSEKILRCAQNDRTMNRRAATSSRGYEAALVKGTAPAAKYASYAEVARRYRDGVERSFAEKDDLRRMLLGIGVDVAFVPRYLSFAVRLARICRDYEMATRENLIRGLVREWEMRLSFTGVTPNPPDREVLLRICELGFGIKFGQ